LNKRPILKVELNFIDKIIEAIGWILLISIWVFVIYNYLDLPDTIPVHYNAAGEADKFGDKLNILALPIIASLLFVGLSYLNKKSHFFNFPTTITKENAVHQYSVATRMIRFLKLAILIIFGLVMFKTIQNTKGTETDLGIWFLPFTLVLIFVPIFYFLIQSSKSNFVK
jgi:uncharacterized membrane protein